MENYKTVDVTAGVWKVRVKPLKVYRQRPCQCGRGEGGISAAEPWRSVKEHVLLF